MAYLKTVEESNKKKEERKEKHKTQFHTKKNWIHKNIYNTDRWRKLRNSYLAEHPLCEECLKNGKSVLAEHIHHINEITNGKTDEEMLELGFNPNNLESLCHDCHKQLHDKNKEDKYFLFNE